MAEYADYEFYKEKFHGSIIPDEAAFLNASVRASRYVKYVTFGRVSSTFEKDYPEYAEDIKCTVCAVADVFYQEWKRTSAHNGREVASENNDGYSVTYADAGRSDGGYSLTEKQAMQNARMYLVNTGLMYCGV